ncbi:MULTISPECIES: hypothetical protein [Paenibacillus]|uniref:Uncharacterized protein n=1 Tax=Paenibacillus albilobatus TaxID=2716884 RepID=A0A919XKZ8_9BACL|nr:MULTISPECIES: hypothetical protein [Paenibacillus]GIO32148.1 hypothetical protein J2TS6_32890 [Paenibacillus albilobatus]
MKIAVKYPFIGRVDVLFNCGDTYQYDFDRPLKSYLKKIDATTVKLVAAFSNAFESIERVTETNVRKRVVI